MLSTRRKERGGTLVVVLTVTVVCAGIAASVILPAIARSRKAQADLANERAFQCAEAGIDWGIAETRKRGGELPSTLTETRSPSSVGEFTITYQSAVANGLDDDGDGITDEPGEDDYLVLRSTGRSGGSERAIEIIVRRAVEVPTIDAAMQLNVETPIIDFNGMAFRISGYEHDLADTEDTAVASKAGIAGPAETATLLDQIAPGLLRNITGTGGTASIQQVDAVDMSLLAQQVASAASIILGPGTHSSTTWGLPAAGQTEVVYAPQDVKISGGSSGAGVLLVDGDLTISGGFEWVGLVVVRGTVNFVGGGGGKRVLGALVVGEEVTSNSGGDIRIGGTVDINYSTEAITMAAQGVRVLSVLAWREVPTP